MSKELYIEVVESASQNIANVLLNRPQVLQNFGWDLDRFVAELLRNLGQLLMADLFTGLARHLIEEAQEQGYEVHENPWVTFGVLFGRIQVRSPYLRNEKTKETKRPLREHFGVEGNRQSEGVQRALSDFGIEKSFDRASRQFFEHYGWEIGRTTVRSRTLAAAHDGEEYLRERFEAAENLYRQPLTSRPGVSHLLAELDGCEIRTGKFMTAKEAGRTECAPDKVVRVEQWREVRTGLTRPLDEVESTYVCRMGPYPEVCAQLFSAGCERGLSSQTQVVAAGDGGIGLMEVMSSHFPNFQYILDRPHLKSHCYQTAEALGLEGRMRDRWVHVRMKRIDKGQVYSVIEELTQLLAQTPNERLENFIGYLKRFSKAVHYTQFKERGWPLGSGEVESAHRYIPQERLKIPGAWWHPDHVNPMLSLRVIRANGWWNEFWTWRINQRQKSA